MLLNIKELTKTNKCFNAELWQGEKMKIELISVMPRQDMGTRINCEAEQIIKIESGKCAVYIGTTPDCTELREKAEGGQMLIISMGTWYNIINIGSTPLKAYVITTN